MKFSHGFIMLSGVALFAAPALAQTAPQTSPAPAATAAPAAPTAGTPVTDAEVTQYARAALDVDNVRKDASIPEADKNARFVAAIEASGLTAVRFNEITQAMQANPALNTRIQTAAAALVAPAASPAPAATPAQ